LQNNTGTKKQTGCLLSINQPRCGIGDPALEASPVARAVGGSLLAGGNLSITRSFADAFQEQLMAATEEELKRALKAFKKRLKMQQLEEDSRLGRSPLTGAKSTITAIQPPTGFGREIWEELRDKGYLINDGGGFYQLVPGK
jgi:hypothetical protein